MRHPSGRAERRFNGEIWRDRQRFIMSNVWHQSRYRPSDWTENNMYWARKQSSAHGNRCMCHCEKTSRKEIRKRREGQDVKSQGRTVSLSTLQERVETQPNVCGRAAKEVDALLLQQYGQECQAATD